MYRGEKVLEKRTDEMELRRAKVPETRIRVWNRVVWRGMAKLVFWWCCGWEPFGVGLAFGALPVQPSLLFRTAPDWPQAAPTDHRSNYSFVFRTILLLQILDVQTATAPFSPTASVFSASIKTAIKTCY